MSARLPQYRHPLADWLGLQGCDAPAEACGWQQALWCCSSTRHHLVSMQSRAWARFLLARSSVPGFFFFFFFSFMLWFTDAPYHRVALMAD